MDVKKNLLIEGKSVNVFLNGKMAFPEYYGKIGIDAVKEREHIIYRSWNIQFTRDVSAAEKDNAGRDEVQIMFNLSQDIHWHVHRNRCAGACDAGAEPVDMAKGEVCVFRNNDYRTSMRYSADVSFKFKSIQMPTSFFRELLSKYFPDREIQALEEQFLTKVTKTFIMPEMYRVLSEIDTSDRFKEYEGVYLEGKMIELTALVLYGIAYHKTGEIKRLSLPAKDDAAKVEQLREKIQRFPAGRYDTDSVAVELGMSVSKLNRLFRSLFASSLHSYVQDQRLEYAARLLREGNSIVSEVALQAGYSNMSHFSKSFEGKYGMPPRKFLEHSRIAAAASVSPRF